MSVAAIKQSFLDHLFGALGRSLDAATRNDKYLALALAVRERVFETGSTPSRRIATHVRSPICRRNIFPDRIWRTIC